MVNDLERAEFGDFVMYLTWTNVLLVANSVLGLIIFEWSWHKTRRFRKPIHELNA